MTLLALCFITLARACVVAMVTWYIAQPLCVSLPTRPRAIRILVLFLLVHPLLVPPLIPAYVYANLALSWVKSPGCAEWLYVTLLVWRALPLYALGHWVTPPPPITPAALHIMRMRPRGNAWRFSFRHGGGYRSWLLWLLVGWSTFHDFEIASFLLRPTWTVWLFDAYAGGADPLGLVLRLWPPVVISGGALALTCHAWQQLRTMIPPGDVPTPRGSARSFAVGIGLAALATSAFAVWPIALLLWQSRSVVLKLTDHGHLLREVLIGTAIATVAAVLAYLGSLLIIDTPRRLSRALVALACGPGIVGSLTLSLGVLCVLQLPLLRAISATHAPWILAQTLALMPKALLLGILVSGMIAPSAAHASVLFTADNEYGGRRRARQLQWILYGQRHAIAGLLVAYLGYLDLPPAAVLAPTRYIPAPVRLYNLMHYGHSETLAAMLLWTFFLPFLVVCVLFGLLKLSSHGNCGSG